MEQLRIILIINFYLNYYNQNLFLITGTGILMFNSLDKIKDEKYYFKTINTNFKDIVGEDYINSERAVVKNLLIKNYLIKLITIELCQYLAIKQ